MRRTREIKCLVVGLGFIVLLSCGQADRFPVLRGPFFGQPLPGNKAELFAPGIVCSGLSERDVAMTPDGNEIYFGKVVANNSAMAIMVSKLVNGRWTKPKVTEFCKDPRYKSLEPAISPDGQKFYFVSDRPDPVNGETEPGNWDIWIMDRMRDGWGEPYNLGSPINSAGGEFYPSVTRDGTMYFTRGSDIYRSRYIEGVYAEPEKLGPNVNCGRAQYNAFIDPDESFIIVPVFGRDDGRGGTDYYIVYRNQDDEWSEPVHLGDEVNSPAGREWSAYVSPDKCVLFFMSDRGREDQAAESLSYKTILQMHGEPQNGNPDIYWVSADIIASLRPDGF